MAGANTNVNNDLSAEFVGMELDDIACRIDELLCSQDVKTLRKVATDIGINPTVLTSEKKKYFIKGVITKFYKTILEGDTPNDVQKKSMIELAAVIASNCKEENELKEDGGQQQTQEVDAKSETPLLQTTNDDDNGRKFDPFLRELGILKKTSLLRKELRIKGQIGEAGQKDKLTYVSLMHQIAEAQAAGYDEDDIVNSVIRAMVPSLTLRTVLESMSAVTLKKLMQFLEAHFDQRNATDLCSKLTSMTQTADESTYSYVMRCIEIRQKVILASRKSDIQYDENLVFKLFFRSLENGISSSFIVQEVKHLLRKGTTDEELIIAVTKASALEKERQAVQCKSKKVKVCSVQPEESEVSKLLSAVGQLTTQINSMKTELAEIKKVKAPTRACEECTKNNVRCYHCYSCGSSNHIARYCRQSGNRT